MDTKKIAFGLSVVAASVGGAAIVSSPTVETQEIKIAASTEAPDVLAAEVANVDTADQKSCVRQWIFQGGETEAKLVWMCNGGYVPSLQAKLDKLATKGTNEIRFTQTPDGKGGLKMDATIVEGPLPEKVELPARAPEPKPVEPAPKTKAEGEP